MLCSTIPHLVNKYPQFLAIKFLLIQWCCYERDGRSKYGFSSLSNSLFRGRPTVILFFNSMLGHTVYYNSSLVFEHTFVHVEFPFFFVFQLLRFFFIVQYVLQFSHVRLESIELNEMPFATLLMLKPQARVISAILLEIVFEGQSFVSTSFSVNRVPTAPLNPDSSA